MGQPLQKVAYLQKQIEWIGSTLEEVRAMPVSVRRSFGYTLFALQLREQPVGDIKRLEGIPGVFEIKKNFGDAFRLVYCVTFEDTVYVLHAFKKKSHRGAKLPREVAALIHDRLAEAQRHHKARGSTK